MEISPKSLLARIIFTTVGVYLGLVVVCCAAWWCGHPEPSGDWLRAHYTTDERYFLPDQPSKNNAYLVGCLALPFLIWGSLVVSTRWVTQSSEARLDGQILWASWLFSLAIYLVCIGSTRFPITLGSRFYTGMSANWINLSWAFHWHGFGEGLRWAFALAVLGYQFLFVSGKLTSSPEKRLNRAFFGALLLIILISPSRFYSLSEMTDDWRYTHHFNSIVAAIAKVNSGQVILVDFPHRYGAYVEFLAPIVICFQNPLQGLIAILGSIDILSIIAICLVHRLLIRSPTMLFMSCVIVIGIWGIGGLDLYYQSALRRLFPSIVVLLTVLYLKRPSYGLSAGIFFLSAFATVWNLDTGVVCCMGSSLGILVQKILANGFSIKQFSPLLGQAFALLITWAAFLVYLISFGRPLHLDWLPRFQYIYGSLGYFCYPLLIPDLWILYIGFVIFPPILLALFYYLKRSDLYQNWHMQALSFLGLMSLGLVSYDVTRTCESNLLTCSVYIPLMGAMILSEGPILISKKILPPELLRFFICPKLIFYYYFIICVLAIPEISTYRTLNPQIKVAAFELHAPFLREWIKPGDPVIILSDLSGPYFLTTRAHDALKLASSDEWLCKEDIDNLVQVLEQRQTKRLVLDDNLFDYPLYRPDVYDRIKDAIAQNYRIIAETPDKRIHLYEANP